jgi:homospermidine synthase
MVNTWSPDGYLEEIFAPVEYTERNSNIVRVTDTCGFYNMVYSAVPSRSFVGYAIRHSESITLGKLLQGNSSVSPVTVFYAYRSCDNSIASLNDLQICKQYSSKRVMTDDIVSGTDEIGILLVSSEYGSYWCGSEKSIEETRDYFDNKFNDLINITTLQTAAGYYAGIMWILQFPNKGVIYPEDIDHSFVLNMTYDAVSPFTCKKVEYNIRDKPKRTVGICPNETVCSIPIEYTFNDFLV